MSLSSQGPLVAALPLTGYRVLENFRPGSWAGGRLGVSYESVYPPQRRAQTHHQRCVTDAGPQLREQLHQTVTQFEPPAEAQVLIEGWRIEHNARALMHPRVAAPGA